ncbi:MAG: hypothetical protein H7256_06115 [Bdellovibrio sp.]|nr:hypothetical protein [Bdellovibrio sp.]
MKSKKILFAILTAASVAAATPSEQIKIFDQRYQLNSPNQKLVDNFGDGNENLYGVRNFRMVLRGILYRGGANNSYNKYEKRNNQNPLPTRGLNNLCQQDFKSAVYLYNTNYSTAPKTVQCVTAENKNNELSYLQMDGLDQKNTEAFLEMIYKAIKGQIPSPIYMHCWNGWHASGLVSTLALKQFCDFDTDQALNYWIQNTDGNSEGYSFIKNRIQTFKPLSQFQITDEEKAQICLKN